MLSQVELFLLGWREAQRRILGNISHHVTDVLDEYGVLEEPSRQDIVEIIQSNTPVAKNGDLKEWCIG